MVDIYPNYVNGEWITTEETITSQNPATGDTVGQCSSATPELVDEAVTAAEDAFDEWSQQSHIDRAEYLWDIYMELRERTDELGQLVTRECGKEISEGRADVVEAYHMVEWAASDSRRPRGDIVPSEIASKDSYMRRKPKGVIGCITPWNFPIAIPFWQIAVSLVEGNTVVWKPSEYTPVCGHEIAQMFDDSGIPDGVFNMVHGEGEPVGESIVRDDRVNVIQFTGSAEVGWFVDEVVGGTPGRSNICEMGGKNGMVITDDCDLDIALHSAVMASFKTTGQRCVSTERLIVHDSVYDEFRDLFVDLAEQVRVGDPLDEATFMGPLASSQQYEKVTEYNELARSDTNTTVLLDRESVEVDDEFSDGHWVGPFIYEIDEYDSDIQLLNEETFGPHVALIRYEGDIERGLEIHNDTDYGLSGSIISENYRELNYFRDHAEIGLAYANLPCIGAEVQLPFGGVKKSGAGFPSARSVIEAVTDRTAWTVNNSKDINLAQGLSTDITTKREESN